MTAAGGSTLLDEIVVRVILRVKKRNMQEDVE
jgi:hypothetical protein